MTIAIYIQNDLAGSAIDLREEAMSKPAHLDLCMTCAPVSNVRFVFGLAMVFCLGLTVFALGDERVDYASQIKPLLQARCFACHGSLKQEAGLRLDTAAAIRAGGDSGVAVTAGDASASLLIERVSTTDIDQRMPPEFEGEQLSPTEVQLLSDWIAQGATSPQQEQAEDDPRDHWAFQPIRRPKVPGQLSPGIDDATPANPISAWGKNPIDAFIAQQHRRKGLTVQEPAPRSILLRRLYLDLIGLPPTPEAIAAVESATDDDWYSQSVEELLDDPRHGQRWARHWMDIWRYSDWWGLGQQLRNSQKHIWHWRDWIIESLNDDVPYDEMVRLMLAADELYPEDQSQLRATGYLARNYFLFNRPQWMEETVEHVSKGFLGLTLNCAKCHDHKYDPIAHADFYRMRAFFEPYHVRMDMLPGESDLKRDGLPRVFDSQLIPPTHLYIRGQETNPDKSREILPGIPEFLAFDDLAIQPVELPATAWQPERQPWVIDNHMATATAKLESAQRAFDGAREQPTKAEQQGVELASTVGELEVAEAALAVAQADQARVIAVAAAMRAEWAVADNQDKNQAASLNAAAQDRRVEAVQAERSLAAANAQLAVITAEQAVQRAAADNKSAAEQALTTTRTDLDKANELAQAEVAATDGFTKLVGAQWTPTRFLDSSKDDPSIEFAQRSSGRRSALANWITDKRNPLTARVAANHIWSRHMGQPLVATVFDFGRNGARPTHPELLDWLACELIEHDWSMKHLHRLIVSSATYRLSSAISDSNSTGDSTGNSTGDSATTNQQLDPDNHFWWRRSAIRLESQVVRDSLLSLAGNLDSSMGGPSIPPAEQAASLRRSLYFFHSNNDRNLFLSTFDEAAVKDCYRREQSIVPQQALALTNSRLVLEQSELIAQRLTRTHRAEQSFIRSAFRELLGFEPGDAELAAASLALEGWRGLPDGSESTARAQLIWALINHNDFVTLR